MRKFFSQFGAVKRLRLSRSKKVIIFNDLFSISSIFVFIDSRLCFWLSGLQLYMPLKDMKRELLYDLIS